ncbi:MAG: HAMP domain-containing sensor histidine kinase [Bacteroidia bacterium]
MRFRHRIALYFSTATALLTGLVFLLLYGIVRHTVFQQLDIALGAERQDMLASIDLRADSLSVRDAYEWSERHHRRVEVNPVFMQIADTAGHVVRKSINLLDGRLEVLPTRREAVYFSTRLAGKSVRQLQAPLYDDSRRLRGLLSIAIPLEESEVVLWLLRRILLIAFPFIVGGLFVVALVTAGRSIRPIQRLSRAAGQITHESLDTRLALPPHRDEIFDLTHTLNDLLGRLDAAMQREQRFTADASHQLRTPLTVVKGTLEVLLRQPRNAETYQERIQRTIEEIDRMVHLVDQLLVLARYDSESHSLQRQPQHLYEVAERVEQRMRPGFAAAQIHLYIEPETAAPVMADGYLLDIMLENLLSNAQKFSPPGSIVRVLIQQAGDRVALRVQDQGRGMTPDEQHRVFERFFRGGDGSTRGHGLGLSIVRRLAVLQDIALDIDSQPDRGTTFSLYFAALAPTDSLA